MEIALDIWVIIDIIIAIGVIIASIMFLRISPKNNKFKTIKYWHIFNSLNLIVLLIPILFGFHWPSWVQFVMIGLILANNFAATLSSYSKLQEERVAITSALIRQDINRKDFEEWKSEISSPSQQQ